MSTAIKDREIDKTDHGAVSLLIRLLEHYSPSREEADVAGFLVKTMTDLGFEAHLDSAGNAIGELGRGERTVLLLGHMDTVPGYIPVRREGDRLYGRGAVDAKGPLATFIMATARAGPLPGLRVVVAGAVEEEAATSKGAYHLLRGPRPDYVIIGEPGGWSRITVGYKGRLLVDYTVVRPTSHTAGPHRPASELAASLWQEVEGLASVHNEGKEGIFATLDPSLRCFNTVETCFDQSAELTIGLRLPPGIDIGALQRQIEGIASTGTISFRGAEEPFRAPKNTPLARAFLMAIRTQGGKPSFVVKTGTADMNVVGPRWQCPIVAYGPGDSSLDHTPHENIAIPEYLRGISVLAHALRGLAEQVKH